MIAQGDDEEKELLQIARAKALERVAMRSSDPAAARALVAKREREREREREARESVARHAFPLEFGRVQKREGKVRVMEEANVRDGRQVVDEEDDDDDDDDEDDAEEETIGGGDAGKKKRSSDDGARKNENVDEEEDVNDEEDAIPMSASCEMEGFRKPTTCCAAERSGARLAAGSSDGTVRLYDFLGMKRDLKGFKTIVVREGYPVHAIDWSPSGDRFVVAGGATRATVHDRDGCELGEFDSGDMYIRDLRNTKGHVSALTDAKWNPIDRSTICTASEDGSARLWDVNYLGDARGSQKAVLKPQLIKPGRVQVTSCAYSHDGDLVALGVTDGSVQIFTSKGSGYKSASVGLVLPPSQQGHLDNHWSFNSRPSHMFKSAHPVGDEVTSMAFARDGRTLLSRCADGTLNVWDVRNVKAPLKRFEDLPTRHSETAVGWSPNDAYFFTGVDSERDGRGNVTDGGLCFFKRETLEFAKRVSTPTNCIAAMWHPRLNQIFVGCGDAKGGELRVLYDEKTSQGGVLSALGKGERKSNIEDFARIDVKEISYAPDALPAFQEPIPGKRKLDASEIARKALRKNPKQPATGQDRNGILSGGSGGTLLTQALMMNNDELGEKNWMKMDARESILRHAEAAAKDPKFTKLAYEKTQPKQIWSEEPEERKKD